MNKGMKGLIIAGSVAVLALSGMIGGTFALFQRQKSVTAHVKIGNLNFEFARVKLEGNVLDDQGYISPMTPDTTRVDLSANGAQAFSSEDGAPGADYTATFELKNTGATAFTTSVALPTVTAKDAEDADIATDLLPLVRVTFVSEGATSVSYTLDNPSAFIVPDVAKGATKNFTMKVEILEEVGNYAELASLDIGMRLTLTQKTSA